LFELQADGQCRWVVELASGDDVERVGQQRAVERGSQWFGAGRSGGRAFGDS
jgi:hypothetical protein